MRGSPDVFVKQYLLQRDLLRLFYFGNKDNEKEEKLKISTNDNIVELKFIRLTNLQSCSQIGQLSLATIARI